MTKTVEFIFDFASPNAYFANWVLSDMCAKAGAELRYTPCLLGGIFKLTNNQAPMIAFADVKNKLEYQTLEIERFIAKHKIDKYKLNPHFPLMTVTLMRAAIAAQEDGFLPEFIAAILPCVWEQGLKMDAPDVMKQAFADAGFDAERLMAQTQNADIKAKLIAHTQDAVDRGAFGVPTFFVAGEMYYGKDSLDAIAARL